MTLPLHIAIKDFFGLWVLTPFEQALLKRLSEALEPDAREVLAYQLAHFTTVRRLIRYAGSPQAYGYTFFYTLRCGKDVSEKKQLKRFAFNEPETLLATTRVIFDSGEIDVRFRLVNGVLFSIEYRSPQKIYYPQGCYDIESLTVRRLGDTSLKEPSYKAVKK
jgi:hypothetical protein